MQRVVVLVCLFITTVCSIVLVVLQVAMPGEQHCVATVDIVTYGDSLTAAHASGRILQCNMRGFGYQQYIYEQLHQVGVESRIHNLGVNAQTSAQIATRVTSALQTDYLLFLMGTNDLPTWTPGTTNNTVTDAIAYALAQQPLVRRGRVLVGTIPPECAGFPRANPGAAEALNQIIRNNAHAYEVVDIYAALVIPGTQHRHPAYCLSDLLHFTDAANQVVGYAFADAIKHPPLKR